MKRRKFWPWAGALALLFVVLSTGEAWAVIPAVVGPVQALIAILPQLMGLLAAAGVALLKPATYRVLGKYLWTHYIFTVGLVAFIMLSVWGCGKWRAGWAGKEQVGAAWCAFRGGPERSGAVPNAKGPALAAKKAWSYQDNTLERVDSSPCVVGNRVYLSTGTLRLIGASTGAVYCRDADKGGEVWRWAGEGLPSDSKLKPIFSSPSVGGEFKTLPKDKDGKFQEGRFLVVGEGYHTDWDSRLICLDLEPVKTGASKNPKLRWFKQTTCHVESSPCILDGKAYTGAADDGLWCVDLESGKTLWHTEGTPAYYLTDCPQAAEIGKLAGKTVAVIGVIKREGATVTEAGQVKLTPEKVVENPAAAGFEEFDNGRSFKRKVVGKVTVVAKPPNITVDNKVMPLEGISKFSIVPDPAQVCMDMESSPIAVNLPREQAPKDATFAPGAATTTLVFCGSGVDGQAVICADGATGRVLWRAKMPFPVYGSPTVAEGKVIVGMGNGDIINDDPNPKGEVRCLSTADGKELWRFEAANTILGAVPVSVADGKTYAYACSRDKNLYVLDVNDKVDPNGTIRPVKKLWVGSPMVCSPAVTRDAVYLTTNGGKVVCMDRKYNTLRWSFNLCPGQEIISSPAVAGGRLLVGSVSKGIFCLLDNPAGAVKKAAAPWTGPGGGADRSGLADEFGLPAVTGQKATRKWASYVLCTFDAEGSVEKSRTLEGPVAACGKAIYLMLRNERASDDKPYLARVDLTNGAQVWLEDLGGPVSALAAEESRVYALVGAKGEPQKPVCLEAATGAAVWALAPDLAEGVLTLAGKRLLVAPKTGGLRCIGTDGKSPLWEQPVGTVIGAPVGAWGLVFAAVGGDRPRLVCLEDVQGRELWSVPLPGKPVGPPAVSAGRIFAACQGQEAGKGLMFCAQVADGKTLWTKDLPAAPVQYPVASEDLVAVAGANGLLFAFGAADGKFLGWETGRQPLEGPPAPALVQSTLVFAGTKRLSTWNATSADWPWYYKDQGVIGRVLAPPVVACETVYVVTERKGLVAVAPPPPPEITSTVPADGSEVKGPRPRLELKCTDEVNGIDPTSVHIELSREPAPSGETPQVLVSRGAWAFDCPELGIQKEQPAGSTERNVTTVTFSSAAPLAAGAYKVTATVGNKAGVRVTKSWGFTVKEGGK